MGGFFVVPLNALLQERVKKASGRGMRLQYKTLAKTAHVVDAGHLLAGGNDRHPGRAIGIGFGALFALAITALWIWRAVINI